MPRIAELNYRSQEKKLPHKSIVRIILTVLLGSGVYLGMTTPIEHLCLPTDLDAALSHHRLQTYAAKQGTHTAEEINSMGYTGPYSCNHSLTDAIAQRLRGLLGE